MNFTKWRRAAILFAVIGLAACEAPAPQYGSEAERVYRNTCVLCHAGSGSSAMTSDLTRIAARNGGDFPMARVIAAIGGEDVREHGSPMPVWGERYAPDMVRDLAEYIASIQR